MFRPDGAVFGGDLRFGADGQLGFCEGRVVYALWRHHPALSNPLFVLIGGAQEFIFFGAGEPLLSENATHFCFGPGSAGKRSSKDEFLERPMGPRASPTVASGLPRKNPIAPPAPMCGSR